MSESCELRGEFSHGFVFLLCHLELYIFVLSDVCDSDLGAERSKDGVVRLIYIGYKLFQLIICRLDRTQMFFLVRGELFQFRFDVFELGSETDQTETYSILRLACTSKHLPECLCQQYIRLLDEPDSPTSPHPPYLST
jgi:hypothetical protein